MNNKIIKILCSLPVIFIFLYFIPFVGICLILLRAFIYKKKNKISTPIILIGVGILIYIPKILNSLLKLFKIEINNIPYLKDILTSNLYNQNFLDYSKYLITAGVILLIISVILKNIIQKVENKIDTSMQNYIKQSVKQDAEISKQNDMEIKLKQQKAKNTSYVKCPSCGSDNLLSEKFGTCKYCRSSLENKNYN